MQALLILSVSQFVTKALKVCNLTSLGLGNSAYAFVTSTRKLSGLQKDISQSYICVDVPVALALLSCGLCSPLLRHSFGQVIKVTECSRELLWLMRFKLVKRA